MPTKLNSRKSKIDVLIIDDDHHDMRLMQWIVNKIDDFDARLAMANSIEEAQEEIENEKFDLILCDFWLSKNSSIDFIKNFTDKLSNIPVVLITSLDSPSIRNLAFSAGATSFISKSTMSSKVLEDAFSSAMNNAKRQAKLMRECEMHQ